MSALAGLSMVVEEFPMEAEVEAGMPPGTPHVLVCFVMCPMRDELKSREAGHDVFVDIEHVRIAIPMDKSSLYFQPATDQHRKRFPLAYGRYKSRTQGQTREGMPIEQWTRISRSLALTLRAANVQMVEDLAGVSDAYVDRIADGRRLRDEAKAFLAQAKDTAATTKLAAEKADLEKRLKDMEQVIADMRSSGQPVAKAPKAAERAHEADVAQDVAAAARRPRARAAA